MTAKIEELAKQERKIPKCEESITNAQVRCLYRLIPV